jgi:hypothetical protein
MPAVAVSKIGQGMAATTAADHFTTNLRPKPQTPQLNRER